ncbi:isoform 4 of serine/threonine-protein phosphatase 6 regulatory ankyrin repeat subunit a [Fagus crenata]
MKSFSNLEIEGEPLKISDDFELETRIRLWQNLVKNQWNEVLKICQENWKSLNIPITNTNDTVLHLAAYNKLEQEFELLLQILPLERDVKTKVLLVKNTEGNTPLHFAASVGSVRMCQSIIDITGSETSLSARNKEGETPLFIAALHGHKNAFLYFHFCGQKDGNNYFRRNDGETILHCAISEEYFELSLTILSLYRDLVNLANMDGMTPLHFLASKPAAFESGSDLRWFEKIIYQSIAKTDELELLTEVERLAIQQYSREGGKVLDRKEERKEDLKVIREIIKEDLDQFSLGGHRSPNEVPAEPQSKLPPNYITCSRTCLQDSAIYIWIGDDKEVRGDEEKAHTVSSDYESFAALRFNASVSTRQISVSCLLTGLKHFHFEYR